MFKLIEGGDVYCPVPAGHQSVLIAGGEIALVGEVTRDILTKLPTGCEFLNASGCLVLPGIIDPHEHLIGAGGEHGFSSRMPEVSIEEILQAGITTVVGCLGTDVTARHLTSLLARARQIEEAGISSYIYTGGFPVPPPTITGSVAGDLTIVDKVIGVGEIAISDDRSSHPTAEELARLVSEALVGGAASGKSGVVNFHVGPGKAKLSLLHRLLDEFEIPPRQLYPTHISRTEALLSDAISLASRGCYVDMDNVERDLGKWLPLYMRGGGDMERLTVSSDAQTAGASPAGVREGFLAAVKECGVSLERVLPLFTSNVAGALGLRRKGRIGRGMDADVVVMDRQTLRLVHVVAGGRWVVRDGQVVLDEAQRG